HVRPSVLCFLDYRDDVGDTVENVGRARGGQARTVVCTGQYAGDDRGAGGKARGDVAGRVPDDRHLAHVGYLQAEDGCQAEVGVRAAAAARVGRAEREVDRVAPAQVVEERVGGGPREAGGQRDPDARAAQRGEGLLGAGKRLDLADEPVVRRLERPV